MSEPPKGQVQIKADEKGTSRPIYEPRRGAPQCRGVHTEFYLSIPHGAAGQAGGQPDRQSGARQAAGTGAARECGAIRGAIRADAGGAGTRDRSRTSDSCNRTMGETPPPGGGARSVHVFAADDPFSVGFEQLQAHGRSRSRERVCSRRRARWIGIPRRER